MDFIGKRKFWYILPLLVIIPGLISLMLQGLNLGIDFAGGTIAQVKFQQEVRIEDLRAELTDQGYGNSKIQTMDDGSYQIKTTYLEQDQQLSLIHIFLKVPLDEAGALEIARRSRGTPRVANRLLRRVRDFAQIKGDGLITLEIANMALDLLDIDQEGLDKTDRLMLETIIRKFAGGPVGLEALAATINEESSTIEDVCEPYLLQQGFISRTPRGRICTPLAYQHLGLPMQAN